MAVTALISLADFKTDYDRDGSVDTDADAVKTNRIAAMSGAILHHLGWPLDDSGDHKVTTATYTHVYRRFGFGRTRYGLLIPVAPVISITSVHVSTDGAFESADLLTSGTDYRLDDSNRALPRVTFLADETTLGDTEEAQVIVSAGYASTPESLESACGMLTAWSLLMDRRRGEESRERPGNSGAKSKYRPEQWPEDILSMLRPYVQPWKRLSVIQ